MPYFIVNLIIFFVFCIISFNNTLQTMRALEVNKVLSLSTTPTGLQNNAEKLIFSAYSYDASVTELKRSSNLTTYANSRKIA